MMRVPALQWRHYACLALVALGMLLPGRMSLPPIDRDESRYMQATSQMLETGNYVDVRFQDQPRYLQPAGIYWLEAASVKLFGTPSGRTPWMYRVPSLLSGILAVLLTARIGQALFGPVAGLGAGLLLACSVLLNVEARMATIDATLLAAVLLAQTALLRLFLDRESGVPSRRRMAVLYWVALGCGLMLKGPVILLVSWGTVLALWLVERRRDWWSRLHAGWGVPVMLAIVLPWCVAIWIVSGGDFFSRAVGHNFLGKVANGQEAHGQPPGFHILLFSAVFWPGSLLAVRALPFIWAGRRGAAIRFLLCWIIPTWLVFELIATKLPHYVLPTYPAIACLVAAALLAPWKAGRVARMLTYIYGAVWLVFSAALALAGPVLLYRLQGGLHAPVIWPCVALGMMGFVFAAGSLLALRRSRPETALLLTCGAAVLVLGSTFGLALPALRTIWLSPRIAQAVVAARPCPDSVLSSSSFSEPSLVFLAGEHTRLVGPAIAADDMAHDPACAMALIGQKDEAAFQARLRQDSITPRLLDRIDGINYSTGRRLSLTLYAVQH